jgi:hypothetical protein
MKTYRSDEKENERKQCVSLRDKSQRSLELAPLQPEAICRRT